MIRDAQRFDVLVIGGGPAGMAAAVRAADCGVAVGIVDDNQTFGGQVWRGVSTDGHKSGRRPSGVNGCGQQKLRSSAEKEFLTSPKKARCWQRETTISASFAFRT